MRLDNPAHIAKVQWYATATYPCSYLPETPARSQVAVVELAQSAVTYNELVRKGFRRSGGFIYRPHCDDCQACRPVRIRVADFSPTRSQRRAAQSLAGLTIAALPLTLQTEHLALYQRYQQSRHDEDEQAMSAAQTQEAYSHFLLRSHVRSNLIELRQPSGELLAVSVVDWLEDGLSAVYTFFDPDAKGSLGTACVLWMVEQARSLGLPYVYLGYWIAQSPKMAYKSNYQPLEVLVEGQWRTFSSFSTLEKTSN
jgi:leucyl-tRNA---protein transferase